MRRLPPGLLALLLSASPALAQKEFGFDNRKPSGQAYLSPEETVKRMKVAPEFEVKLFAGEPLVVNPIAFTIDERGRVWAVECFEYPSKTPPGKMPRDRIVILEDTDGDGKADKRTVFAEGKDFPERFDMASGIEVGHGGVFVGAPPYLWFIENKNDRPGKFEKLLSGFGSQDTHETLNTFQWGPDGWLYGLHGVFTQSNVKSLDGAETRMNAAVWRFHPRTRKFEIFAEGTSNPWGMDWRNTDGQFILACCVIPHLYHIVPGGIYKRQAGASFNPYAYGYINEICDHTFHRESGWAHAGLISLDVPHMPEKYRNSVIFGSIHGCSIKQNVLKPNGSSFTASKGEDFLVSGDKNFRPINMKWGPLGDIYLIDWHDQNPCHQAKPDSWDYERGRVYRIQLKGTQAKKAEDLGKLDVEALAKVAVDPNPYRGRTAWRLLDERLANADRGIDYLRGLLAAAPQRLPVYLSMTIGYSDTDEKGAARDLQRWLIMMKRIPPEKLNDDYNSFGLFIRGLGNTQGTADMIGRLAEVAASDAPPTVRRELASAAVRFADKHDVTPLLHALMAHKEDAADPLIPYLVWFAYEKVIAKKQGAENPAEKELAWLAEQAPGNPFVRDAIVPKVMRRLVATGQPADLSLCVKFLGDVSDAATRKRALEGLAVALQGQTVDAPAAWAKVRPALLATKDAGVTSLVNSLSVAFRDPQAFKRAVGIAANAKRPAAERAEAVRQLAQLKNPEAVRLLIDLAKGDAAEPVRVEAVRAMANFAGSDVPAGLVGNWAALPPAARAEAVNVLAGRKEWAATLLSAMKEKVIDRAAVTDNTILRIQAFKDRALNKLIEDAWGRTRSTPADLAAVIDKMRNELAAGPGSFARGKVVFDNQCAKCHKFDGRGSEVGPPLDGAGRDIEYLLANVLDPNRVVGAPYFLRQVSTLDGQVLQGVLAEEDDRTLTLKVENGVLKKVARADLDGPVKVLEKSMMPEGLAAGMSVQDFRDLIRYVMAHPFFAAVTVNGKPTAVPVTGLIPLPAADGKPVEITATVTATEPVKTKLLVGATDPFEVRLDGNPVGDGKGTGGRPEPDREAVAVAVPKGTHTLTIVVRHKGAVPGLYARLLDPDRKLRYTEAGR